MGIIGFIFGFATLGTVIQLKSTMDDLKNNIKKLKN